MSVDKLLYAAFITVLRCALCLLPAAPVHAVEPSLSISFDGHFDAMGANGAVAGEKLDSPQLVAGRFGQAMRSGPASGHMRFPTQNVLNPEQGSLFMWVSPVDWQGESNKFHVFFQAEGAANLYLYKYYEGSKLLFLLDENPGRGPYYSLGRTLDWRNGQWYHLAATWSPQGLMLYIDGQPVTRDAVHAAPLSTFKPYFTVGDLPWHTPRTTSTLIDEVKIYDIALDPAEVKQLYDRYMGQQGSAPLFSAGIVPLVGDHDGKVLPDYRYEYRLKKSRLEPPAAAYDIETSVLRDGRLFSVRNGQFDGYKQYYTLDIDKQRPGEYTVQTRVFRDGEVIAELSSDLVVPDLSALSADIAAPAAVPAPWSAVRQQGMTLQVQGRDYDFGEGFVAAQIHALDTALLDGAVQLLKNGVPWSLMQKSADIRADDKGLWGLVEKVYAGAAGAECRVENNLEYDGLLRVALRCDAELVRTADSLRVDIPLKRSIARYFHRWSKDKTRSTGSYADRNGLLYQSDFIPFYWLGNDRVGLFWYAEDASGWPNAAAANAIEVFADDNRVTLRLNVKAAGQPAGGAWQFDFGLMATPVKLPEYSRHRLRVHPAAAANIEIIWPDASINTMKYYGYPRAARDLRFARLVSRINTDGRRAIPYLCPTHISEDAPEWPVFEALWDTGDGDFTSTDVQKYGAPFIRVNPLAPWWPSLFSERTRSFVGQFDLDGVYYDNLFLYPLAATRRPVDGHYPLLAYRRLLEKLYIDVKCQNPDALVIGHASGQLVAPLLSFVDVFVDGEQYRNRLQGSYVDVVSMAQWRAEFVGRQWGFQPLFLPQFPLPYRHQAAPTRELMMLMLLHNIPVWPLWSDLDSVDEAQFTLHKYKDTQTDFVAYHAGENSVSHSLEDVYVSHYSRPGDMLLVAGNLARQQRRGSLCVEAGAEISVKTWPAGENLKVDAGCFEAVLGSRDYAMYLVESL